MRGYGKSLLIVRRKLFLASVVFKVPLESSPINVENSSQIKFVGFIFIKDVILMAFPLQYIGVEYVLLCNDVHSTLRRTLIEG